MKAIEACYEHLDEAFVGLSLISLPRKRDFQASRLWISDLVVFRIVGVQEGGAARSTHNFAKILTKSLAADAGTPSSWLLA